jgi:hypothetical protein
MKYRIFTALSLAMALSGCGTPFTSSTVRDVAGEDGVQIVTLSHAVVRRANLTPFTNRSAYRMHSR